VWTGLELLRQVSHPDARTEGHGPAPWRDLSRDRPKDARLAAPVGAHDADPLPGLDLEGDVGEDLRRPIGDAKRFDSNYRHGKEV
jgi:hypothetical protein